MRHRKDVDERIKKEEERRKKSQKSSMKAIGGSSHAGIDLDKKDCTFDHNGNIILVNRVNP
jgi:hypothetical protein